MDIKPAITGVGGAVVTAVAILLFQNFTTNTVDSIEAGQEAQLKQLIRDVIAEQHKLDDGTTYSAALSSLVTDVKVMKSQMGALTEE